MAELNRIELDNLIKIYQSARLKLFDTIVNHQGVGTKVYANTILQHLDKTLKLLEKQTNDYTLTAIPDEYRKSLDEVYAYFSKNKLLMKPPILFAQIHNDAIYEIAREMQYQIGQGLAQVGRQVKRYVNAAADETLRQAGLAATGGKYASGGTVRQMKQNLVEMLQKGGFMTVQYGDDPAHQVGIDSYASMVARSTTRETGNIARENQLMANGYDLMIMTTHYPTCPVCAQYQGRVYSISGKDTRFPPLSRAFSNGYRNIHPNCRHSVHPYIESLHTDEELKADIERSNRDFKDDRDKKQVDLYNHRQSKNRKARQDLYQYERYKARLGEDAPKSLSAFKKLKFESGQAWEDLSDFYKYSGLHPGIRFEVFKENNRLFAQKEKIRSTLPKQLYLTDQELPVTLNVSHDLVNGVVPSGATLTSVRIMAGDGVSTDIRVRHELTSRFGGLPEKWEKKGAITHGDNFSYDIHWYENNGIAAEETFKLKGVKPR